MWATNYLMEMSQMCQTLHNILKSFAYDAIPATPAFCVQIQSDV